jgi:hypothetical protein
MIASPHLHAVPSPESRYFRSGLKASCVVFLLVQRNDTVELRIGAKRRGRQLLIDRAQAVVGLKIVAGQASKQFKGLLGSGKGLDPKLRVANNPQPRTTHSKPRASWASRRRSPARRAFGRSRPLPGNRTVRRQPLCLSDQEGLPRWLQASGFDPWERGNRWVLEMAQTSGAGKITLLALWDRNATGDARRYRGYGTDCRKGRCIRCASH